MSKRNRPPLSEAEQAALNKFGESIAEQVKTLTQPLSDLAVVVAKLAEPVTEAAVDFRPLMKVLAKISAERCQTLEQQQAVFERALLEYDLDPNEYDWTMTAHGLATVVGYAETMSHREWSPGRDDLAPLFELEELTAS